MHVDKQYPPSRWWGLMLLPVLNGLPRRDRELLLLIARAELSCADAADALGATGGRLRFG
jgi:DNA-directed RNA polymerase specialized sigma24 family protein